MISLSLASTAKTLYVAPDGNDSGTGSMNSPWRTWGKAFRTATAGDTVFFRGGIYFVSTSNDYGNISNSGTSDNPICFHNYPNEEPILDFGRYTAGAWTYGIRINGDNYLDFKGLTIRNLVQSSSVYIQGIYVENSHHVTLNQIKVYNIGGPAYGIYGCNEVYVRNCDAWNLCDSLATRPGQNGDGFQWDSNVDGFGESMYNSKIYFEGCRAWDFSDNGFGGIGVGYVEMNNCWAFNGGRMAGDGCGFKYGRGSFNNTNNPLSMLIRNCIAANNGLVGFTPNNAGGTPFNGQYYNNFAFHNGYKHNLLGYDPTYGNGFLIFDFIGSPAPNEMYANNISYQNEHQNVWAIDNYIHTHNSWDITGIEVNETDFISLDWSQMRQTRKSDGSLPDIAFGKLASGSDLINAGTDVGLPFFGTAPDLGWSETFINQETPTNPLVVSSVIENATPSTLEIIFNLSLTNIIPPTSAFSVMVNSSARTVSSVAISGTKLLLTLDNPVIYGDVVTVAYTKPTSNPIQTPAGGQAATITAQSVANNVAAIIPVYVSSVIQNATPARLEMTYNLSLANIVPGVSAFAVKVNNVTRTVSSVAVSGSKVLLTLASPVYYGDAVTVAYTKPATNPLQTISGGQAATITAQSVINNVVAIIPVYVNSVIQNATPARLEMNYNLSLVDIAPATAAFAVKVNNVARTVSSVSVSGTKVLLTLASPVIYGDVVTVAYTKPASNPLQTTSGVQAATITAQNVTNNVGAVNQPPYVSISSPTKSSAFITPATITIDAVASDPDGTISKVEFFQGTTKLGERTASPYSFIWKEVPAGTFSITAAATDNKGLRTISSSVIVVVEKSTPAVNKFPMVSIKIQNNGRPKKNDDVTIVVEAFDPDGTISKVELKSGNVILTEMKSSPYIYTYQNVDTGTYVITAIATDNKGAVSFSNVVEFRVDLFDPDPDLINLYPNPNNGNFKIDILSELPAKERILSVLNMAGNTIFTDYFNIDNSSKELLLTDIKPGFYILVVTYDNLVIATKKFIKQ